jgi:hypothetical protein
MGRTACTEPQCLYKGAKKYIFLMLVESLNTGINKGNGKFHPVTGHEGREGS